MEIKPGKTSSVWKNHTFMKLFSAYGISSFGGWFDYIAILAIVTFEWKSSPLLIALLPISYALPGILLGQVAGVLADRWDKRKVMIVSNLLRAMFTFSLLLASGVWILYGILLMRAILEVINLPAEQAMTRHVVSDDQLLQATSLNTLVFQLAKIIGPLLGASLLSVTSSKICLLVNGSCLLIACFLLSWVGSVEKKSMCEPKIQDAKSETNQETKKQPFIYAWKDGWSIVLGNKVLLVSLCFMLLVSMTIQFVDSQMSVLIREVAPLHPEWMGWGIALFGLGAITMIGLLQRWKAVTRYGLAIGMSAMFIGGCFFWLGSLDGGLSFVFLILPCLIGGAGTGLWSVTSNYLFMNEAPKEAVGRVMGIVQSMSSIVWVIAPLLGGGLVTLVGPNLAFQLSGLVLTLLGIGAIMLQRRLWPQRKQEYARDINVS
ncbi:MFS transporter [Brevibacillus laterosporus]|nr:MFS transporter [Brevibacillus laterosporus]TPG91660.1 MFS transporter [Brevibacillus laterosporus]